MINAKFIFNFTEIIIQCKPKDLMKEVIQNFYFKANIIKKNLIFMSEGNIINENDEVNTFCKNSKEIIILACDMETTNINKLKSKTIISKDIICPSCKLKSFINIKDFKITISGCKNGHKTESILLSEYEKTQ